MIGLRSLWAAIRRNRRVWVATGLLGLIVGASLPLVLPHKSLAVTDLYLAQTAGADPAQAMADNVSLLETNAVAKQAVSVGHLDVSSSALLSHYSGLPLSDTIMSIKFNGASQSDAVAGARAVAQAFLAVQAKELRLQTDVLVNGLQSEISSLNTAIGNLNTQISSLSGASSTGSDQTTNQITSLVNQRSADQSQVFQLQAQVQQAHLERAVRQRRQPRPRSCGRRLGLEEEGGAGRCPFGTRRRSRSWLRRRDLRLTPHRSARSTARPSQKRWAPQWS